MFDKLQKQVKDNFDKIQKTTLYYVDIDRDKIFQVYLDGFDPKDRQEHNCNCCKSFLRQFGGAVTIVDNKVISIWDNIDPPEMFAGAVKALKEYVHSLPISSTFYGEQKRCGTEKNLDQKRNVIWKHFYVDLDPKYVKRDIPTIQSRENSTQQVFKRALEELSLDAVEVVLELIDQNSLYRGKESENTLKEFLKYKKAYEKLPEDQKGNYCWINSKNPVVSNIRNSAIGTLLIDLSSGMDIDTAVTRFERVVAPTNYKRPTALVTNKMVQDAKDKLNELGFLESLERRYATPTDIEVENLLYIDKSSEIKDVFDEFSEIVDIKKLAKVEEITIQDFIEKVIPKTKSMEILVENRHLPNFASLIAPEKESKPLFKWGNGFSWSYTGGITDSIKEKVKAAGGKVDGVLRASLAWSNHDDLDLHCIEPNGSHIYFRNKLSVTGGNLDVDMNAGYGATRTPVENIAWPNENKMQEGVYKVSVHNFCKRDMSDQSYTLQIECNGEMFEFSENKNPNTQQYGLEVQFHWSRKEGIKFNKEVKSSTLSKQKWGVKTNTFVKVKQSMLSPNYWGQPVGNKHYMFILDGCISDEPARPFFNEFLNQDLDAHRKVLEILGSKIKVKETASQLSGIGFSETQKNSVIVRVNGSFKRTLKVTF